MIEDARS